MKIAVLGTGAVGSTLGKQWLAAGHEVVFGSRDPASEKVQALLTETGAKADALAQAAQHAEVVVLAAPWPGMQDYLKNCGSLKGKVLIDCTNPLNSTFTGLDLGYTTSAAEEIANWAEGAHVVKAFNTASAKTMADPQFGEHPATMFYCGDNVPAKQKVKQLVEDLGFEAVDAGPLLSARYLEPLAMLYIHLAVREGWGAQCAFKILQREKK